MNASNTSAPSFTHDQLVELAVKELTGAMPAQNVEISTSLYKGFLVIDITCEVMNVKTTTKRDWSGEEDDRIQYRKEEFVRQTAKFIENPLRQNGLNPMGKVARLTKVAGGYSAMIAAYGKEAVKANFAI